LPLYKGWKVAIAGTSINFLMGISYTWSIFASGLVREFGWTQAQAALPYTVFIFCYAFIMVITGRIQDQLGPRLVVVAGSFFLGGAFILSSIFLTPSGVAIFWGLFYGIGFACGYASVTPAALKWFPVNRKGLVTGLVVSGAGLSAFVMAPTVNLLVGGGVQRAFLIIGVVLLAGIIFLAQFVSNPPDMNSQKDSQKGEVERWYRILKIPQFYMLWIMFCFMTGTGLTFVTHMNRIVEVHTSFEKGYIMVGLFAFFNAAGRLAVGFLSDLVGRRRAMVIVFSTTMVTMFFTLIIQSPLMMGAAISVLGLTYGGLYSLFPATTVSYFGEANFGLNFGLIFTGLGIGGLFPLLAGYLFEYHGNFSSTFILLGAVCLVSVILSLIIKKPLSANTVIMES